MARFIGDYEVLSELGVGHFGTVYLAAGETPARGRVPAKRRLVAIKKLRDSADPRSVDLLLQEFALLEQVKHRGIVRVYEYLEVDHAVVMEHIHGVTLRQVLEELARAREQVFTEAAVEIGCELADALYQAYTTPGDNGEPLQLVHRDLKPANVMLTPQGEVKILDFGLARVDNADFAKDDPERIKGTPIYMAPEQARGEAVDHRTDLFALGLILYELLEGEPAYRVPGNSRDPLAEIYAAIEAGDLRRQCADLESRLPALGPVVSRLLQRRPEDRYQTGHDLLVDLRRQLYRDRGSYLKEFCEFFFGAIHPIPDAPTLDLAIQAMRHGAIDLIPAGIDSAELFEHIHAGLNRTQSLRERERRALRLRGLCLRLNSARQEVSRHVGELCSDLVEAYQDLSTQLDHIGMSSELNCLLRQELDLEALLRTTLEYLLSKVGSTNAAIFLPSSTGEFSLGAYVNYDRAREEAEVMLDHLASAFAPRFEDQTGSVWIRQADELELWMGDESHWLEDCETLVVPCHEGGECLAVLTAFRKRHTQFTDADRIIIETLGKLFGKQLARVISIHHRHIPKDKWGAGE
ncbi:MAG: serine/threonine protein kinase [Deltaproteobacteria bacterium]|nr:MAG: serine/threonine protein kinase [Deltaproteobacteria bacterium]